MCNEAYRRTQIAKLIRDFGETRIALDFPEGVPNFAPLDSIRITDRLEIVRTRGDHSDTTPADPAAPLTAEMVTRRRSWPAPSRGGGGGRPVYNFRSDGRTLTDSASDVPVRWGSGRWVRTKKGGSPGGTALCLSLGAAGEARVVGRHCGAADRAAEGCCD